MALIFCYVSDFLIAIVIKCHKKEFYGTSWHMPYYIRCHKAWQYGYQKKRIDQTKWFKLAKRVWQEQDMKQNPKTTNKAIPLYFWPKCFVNLIVKCWYLKWLRFKWNFLCSLYTHKHKLSISIFREYLKFLFFNTP